MKKRTGLIVSIVLFVVIAATVFALLPTIHPLTLEYSDVTGREYNRIVEVPRLRYYIGMWKGTLMRGYVGESFKYLGRVAAEPFGILFFIGMFYLATLAVWIYVSWLVGSRKGRAALGVVLGLFFGIIGLIAMSLLPDATRQ